MKVPVTRIELGEGTIRAATTALKSGRWIDGVRTKKFEERFAKLCGVRYAASCSSGTAALFLALCGLRVGKGDEVIVPSFSFVATASCVSMCGAKPVFADVDSHNYTLSPGAVQKKITRRTKAIIPVHLFGHPADMGQITEIASQSGITVIEDAAQAHGARYEGRTVGSIGDAACFSFYPSKNLTVCGDGGMITTNDKKLADHTRVLRDHGQTKKYVHSVLGYNFRMDEVHAAIGTERLGRLKKSNVRRREIAKRYSDELPDSLTLPIQEEWAYHVYHQYAVRSPVRDRLVAFLRKMGIGTAIHYPTPIHKQPLYAKSATRLPVTERLAEEIVSLPMFPTMTGVEQGAVIGAIKKFAKRA